MRRYTFCSSLLLLSAIIALGGCGLFKDKTQAVPSDEELFTKGENYLARKKFDKAIKEFKDLLQRYPRSRYFADAQLLMGDALYGKGSYTEAKYAYSRFIELHPAHPKVERVYFRIGDCDFNRIMDKDRDQTYTRDALASYRKALKLYPKSRHAEGVSEKMKFCKVRIVESELYIAGYYQKTKRYTSAIERLEGLVEEFAGIKPVDEALYMLGNLYLKVDRQSDALKAYSRLITFYPDSKHTNEARDMIRRLTAVN